MERDGITWVEPAEGLPPPDIQVCARLSDGSFVPLAKREADGTWLTPESSFTDADVEAWAKV